MEACVIRTGDSGENQCHFCARLFNRTPGMQLSLETPGSSVCEECGRKHAPALSALLHLGKAAERVVSTKRPLITPPLTLLLQLAMAAEKYAQTLPMRQESPKSCRHS